LCYFHGHSVGGTNPSLLEAMACGCNIAAHRNVFNKAVLQKEGDYFSSEYEIADLINFPVDTEIAAERKQVNFEKIRSTYNWENIIEKYELLMLGAMYPKEKPILEVSLTASESATG
jgi:glycosyltransferase involved in cell wall biosynthesis